MERSSTKPDERGCDAAAQATVIASLSARFRIPLRRFFTKRRIPKDDVDDLVQDVFVRMASRPEVESMERLEAYLTNLRLP